jgi:tRNA 2-thiouridine synthesizing protein D
MIFSVVVSCSPHSPCARSALNFIHSAVKLGHSVLRVFFYQEGVFNANKLSVLPQDERSTTSEWEALKATHNIELVVCVAASLRRGILDTTEAKRYGISNTSLSDSFELSGLGQLVDATLTSDRIITFK